MRSHEIDFDTLAGRIREILYDYVACRSFTNTEAERSVEDFFTGFLRKIPYFGSHSESWGLFDVPGDRLGRKVCWAAAWGSGPQTVVLVHHYDVVDVEDYKTLKDLAFSPDALRKALLTHKAMLPEEAQQDLESGEFLFGRGVCDMKGGGAIQYALLEQYAALAEEGRLEGNVIVIGVPDEENLSAGMRAAVRLLAQLKRQRGLQYRMMLNSEPHQRKDFSQGIFSEGSVGKMMPFIYVRGFLSHAGKVFEGLNPVSVLSEIVCRTEVNMAYADAACPQNGEDGSGIDGEAAPPPTWLYMKDSKERYDVSMPLSAYGCFSVLTLRQTPQQLLGKVEKSCREGFTAVIRRMNENYAAFCRATGRDVRKLPWQAKVVTFRQLYDEALAAHGTDFEEAWQDSKKAVLADMEAGRCNMLDGNLRLVETVYDYIEDISPRAVYGLLPPYYPNVSNLYFRDAAPQAAGLCGKLKEYTLETFGQVYTSEYFYTGICDLSYINIDDPAAQRESVAGAMPLLGEYYDIPFEEIQEISMAGMNIGPWGKDFHKLTERVYKEDLYVRTPQILDTAITELLRK